jgi:trehalose-6-phosphate synthase
MDKLVGMINGKFSTLHWSPIRYIYGCIEQVTACATDSPSQ